MNSFPVHRSDDAQVPKVLRVSAAIGWRVLVVAGAVAITAFVAVRLAGVVVPLAIALLLAALLAPAVHWLHAHGMARGLAVRWSSWAGSPARRRAHAGDHRPGNGVPALSTQLAASADAAIGWLTNGPLRISGDQLRRGRRTPPWPR